MEGMSDTPSWNEIDAPVLNAVVLLASQGENPDDERVRSTLPSPLTPTEVRRSLVRLIDSGRLTGHPIYIAERVDPIRVVDLAPTSAGLEDLNR